MATGEPAAASGSKGCSQYQTQRTVACLSMVLLRYPGSRVAAKALLCPKACRATLLVMIRVPMGLALTKQACSNTKQQAGPYCSHLEQV